MKRIEPTISHLDSMELDVRDVRRNPYATPETTQLEQTSGLVSEPTWFGFRGRLSLLRYWPLMILFVYYAPVLAGLVYNQYSTLIDWQHTIAFASMVLIFYVIGLSLIIRRLHDANASGWWSLLFFVPVLAYFFPFMVGFIPGTKGDNRFGLPNVQQHIVSKVFSWLMILSLGVAIPYAYIYLTRLQAFSFL